MNLSYLVFFSADKDFPLNAPALNDIYFIIYCYYHTIINTHQESCVKKFAY